MLIKTFIEKSVCVFLLLLFNENNAGEKILFVYFLFI
jgi:hypothetical protein